MTEMDQEHNRKLAKEFADRWRKTADHLQEELASTHRWILASCLSVNGAGIVFALSQAALDQREKFFSSLWFCVGLVTTILYAVIYTTLLSKTSSVIDTLCSDYESFSRGTADKPGDEEALASLDRIGRVNFVVDKFEYSGLACFVIGAVICGFGIA